MTSSALSPYIRLPVLDAWDETRTLRGVALDFSLHPVPHRPGQAIKLRSGAGYESFFALASARANDGRTELLVKRGTAVADEIVRVAAPGAELEGTPPAGAGFPVEKAIGKEVLLFAAGSGISSIRSLVQHLLVNRADFGRVTLFYGHQQAGDFAYLKEHEAWRREGVEVILCCSQADGNWPGARGYVQEVARDPRYRPLFERDPVAFVCGMKPMLAGVQAMLQEAGIAPERTFLNI